MMRAPEELRELEKKSKTKARTDSARGPGNTKTKVKPDQSKGPEIPAGFTASELVKQDFPEPIWIIEPIIPEGLTILAGKPKLGKSWLALGIAIAVATGGRALGEIAVDAGRVLYLALEDGPRRLKKRLLSMLPESPAPETLHIHNEWPKMDKGGLRLLDDWMTRHKDTRLIVVDTMAKLWPRSSGKSNENMYNRDYELTSNLKAISDLHNIGVIAIHHLRKAASDDPLEQISGSMGISGSIDTALILQRVRGKADATLFATGRDLEETELALQFDRSVTSWFLLGDAAAYKRSHEQTEVMEILKENPEPMSLGEIAYALGKKKPAVHKHLTSLLKDGLIEQLKRGKYIYSENSEKSKSNEKSEKGEKRRDVHLFTDKKNSGENLSYGDSQKKEAFSPFSPFLYKKIICVTCEHFKPNETPNLPGTCNGKPWDQERRQFPRLSHECANYRERKE